MFSYIRATVCMPMLVISMASALAAPPPIRVSVDVEEFNGPLPGWGNVKSFGAVGDGVADDTAAIQSAINSLGKRVTSGNAKQYAQSYVAGSPAVLYIPTGTYRITGTLYIQHRSGAHLVGESPDSTTIKWNGPAGGTMLISNGNLTGKFERITWDGNGSAGIGVAHWWNAKKNLLGELHGGSSHHTDEKFLNMKVGISAGCCSAGSSGVANAISHPGTLVADAAAIRNTPEYISNTTANYWAYADYGQVDSEGTVRRVKFINNTVAGIQFQNPNAVNWWVWDSVFSDCTSGVSNAPGSGGFFLYRNLFQRSTFADVRIANTGVFSLHNNVSIGSKRFFHAAELGRNGAQVVLKGNRIVNTTSPTSIYTGNLGPLVLLDNEIRSLPNSPGPVVKQDNWVGGRDVVSIGNRYTVEQPKQISMRYDADTATTKSRTYTLDDQVVAAGAISALAPTMPATPPVVSRAVFAVSVTNSKRTQYGWVGALSEPVGTGKAIQDQIDAAIASGAENPIVYLPPAKYLIDKPIVIPAQARIQLVGDGVHSAIYPSGGYKDASMTLLQLKGPSYATVKDVNFTTHSHTAIGIDNADQSGGRILSQGVIGASLNINGLTQTRFEAVANTGYRKINVSNSASVLLMGLNLGPTVLGNNSRVAIQDIWQEGPQSLLFTPSSGVVSVMSAMLSPSSNGGTSAAASISLDGFAGWFSLIGSQLNLPMPSNGITIGSEVLKTQDATGTNALFLGTSLTKVGSFSRAHPVGNVGFVMMKQAANQAQTSVMDALGVVDSNAVRAGLAQIRGVIWDSAAYQATAGATDIRLHRIWMPDTAGMRIEGN